MVFPELDGITRTYMLAEFEREEASGRLYRSCLLSPVGLGRFATLMSEALANGDEIALANDLADPAHWNNTDWRSVKGKRQAYAVSPLYAAERLANLEFNTWYVRGLCKRLLDEGVAECRVCRGADIPGASPECATHDGQIYPVEAIYEGHRARYWHEPGNPLALSIPANPGCRHTIARC